MSSWLSPQASRVLLRLEPRCENWNRTTCNAEEWHVARQRCRWILEQYGQCWKLRQCNQHQHDLCECCCTSPPFNRLSHSVTLLLICLLCNTTHTDTVCSPWHSFPLACLNKKYFWLFLRSWLMVKQRTEICSTGWNDACVDVYSQRKWILWGDLLSHFLRKWLLRVLVRAANFFKDNNKKEDVAWNKLFE